MNIIVIGAGVFGLTAGLELRRRGHRVTLLEADTVPAPLAASTDISKVIRMEYGPDEDYMALMEEALAGWRRWNTRWQAAGHPALFHETGVLMMSRAPMAPGGFEHESFTLLRKRGHTPERLDAATLARRFPAWQTGRYVDGFYHAAGGYAESGRVIGVLAEEAREVGIKLYERTRVVAIEEAGGRVCGVRDAAGKRHRADAVVVAAGAWTSKLTGLGTAIRPTGHPVFHLRPTNPSLFTANRFPTFTADVARTGFYGFPLHREGVVKIGNHGPGLPVDPDGPREVPRAAFDALRAFLATTFPDLADAPIVYTRLCLYADTQDEDFWIASNPQRPGLTVAGGGSGHGFKFAPVLGPLVADAVEGRGNPWLRRFRWRPELRLAQGREAARCHQPGAPG